MCLQRTAWSLQHLAEWPHYNAILKFALTLSNQIRQKKKTLWQNRKKSQKFLAFSSASLVASWLLGKETDMNSFPSYTFRVLGNFLLFWNRMRLLQTTDYPVFEKIGYRTFFSKAYCLFCRQDTDSHSCGFDSTYLPLITSSPAKLSA